MRRMTKDDIHPDNPYWANLVKLLLVINDMSIGTFMTVDYIREKLELILQGKAAFHPIVEKAYQETIERAQKREGNQPSHQAQNINKRTHERNNVK